MLGFQLFDGPDGDLLADFGMATSVEISEAEHGFEALSAFVPMSEDEAARWYAMPGAPWAVLSAGWGAAWEGRVEDMAVADGGIEIGAFGAWRALSDAPYTALWSRTTTAGWRAVTQQEVSIIREGFGSDNNNRLYIGAQKGASYGNGIAHELTYAAPHNGQRSITNFSCDYSFLFPTNWLFRVVRQNDDFTGRAVQNTVTATGALLTGSLNLTLSTAMDRISIGVFNNTGGNSAPAGETGDNFLRLTNIRIKTTTASSVTADLIATDMMSYIHGINSSQLRNITALIQSPGVDLRDELYEDRWPADILTDLAGRGDATGQQYEVGVWENRTLHLRPRYSISRTWLVDAGDLMMSRTVDTLRNEMYAVYRDANNRLLRTDVAASPTVGRDPFVRRGFLNVRTTSLTQAEGERDNRLADTAVVTPRVLFTVNQLFDETGAGPYPLWMARSGDLVVVRNLSPAMGTAVDRLRTFRIKRKRYSVLYDRLEITPELELPDLAVMVGKAEWQGSR
ncbi:MAG: hypothetical protein IAE79_28275 [Anaerolinea sp.]|nr:hypothetical protein [Anaerolinea sp.]